VQKAFARSYDVYTYRGDWYGIPTCAETFDPAKAKAAVYRRCLRADSQQKLEQLIQLARLVDWMPEIVRGGCRRAKIIVWACLDRLGLGFDRPVIQNTRSLNAVMED
jgi:hypothetical protein